jgi:hypothetical protein
LKKLLIFSFLALGYQSASAQLILRYDFNGNALDQSGRSNNGILWGGATYGMDRFGNSNSALAVNTENGVISQGNIGITGNNSFTMSIWIKPTDDPTWPNGQIMHVGDEGLAAASGTHLSLTYCPYHATDGGNWDANRFSLFLDGDGPGAAVITDPVSTLNFWSQMVVTYEATSGAYSFYLNGNHQENNYIQWGDPQINLSDAKLRVNAKPLPNGLARGLHGLIDDVRIYDRTLSSTEAAALYAIESVPEPSALSLIAVSLAGLALVRRRRS